MSRKKSVTLYTSTISCKWRLHYGNVLIFILSVYLEVLKPLEIIHVMSEYASPSPNSCPLVKMTYAIKPEVKIFISFFSLCGCALYHPTIGWAAYLCCGERGVMFRFVMLVLALTSFVLLTSVLGRVSLRDSGISLTSLFSSFLCYSHFVMVLLVGVIVSVL